MSSFHVSKGSGVNHLGAVILQISHTSRGNDAATFCHVGCNAMSSIENPVQTATWFNKTIL